MTAPAACGCTKPDPHIQLEARSHACAAQIHGGCTGYSGDYDTYMCGCSCHWCPGGLHLREKQQAGGPS
jgi:hypothetical protein